MAKHTEKIRLNVTSHSVRASQAVLQYGVGAMVDFPSQTLMTAAPEYWNDQIVRIHDERLEKSLGVRYFGMPAGGMVFLPEMPPFPAAFPMDCGIQQRCQGKRKNRQQKHEPSIILSEGSR